LFALSAHGIDQYRKSFTGRLADLLLYWSVHFVTTRGRTMGWIMTLIIGGIVGWLRSEEHTSELQSRENLVCRLLIEKQKAETDADVDAAIDLVLCFYCVLDLKS